VQGKPLVAGGKKIHGKVITWIEHHPSKSDEMLTASAGKLRLSVVNHEKPADK
jgi:hypothetical protein